MAGKVFEPPARVVEGAHVQSLEQYKALYQRSIQDPSGFWSEIASGFHWEHPFNASSVISSNFKLSSGSVGVKWFEEGKTNICYNALDRHVNDGHGDQIAYFWEGNEPTVSGTITYSQLLARVKKVANVLRKKGVVKGDNVAIYLPMIPEIVVTMLACARIGAPHSIVFGGFSSEALADRVLDCKAKVLVTADGVFRGAKMINLYKIVTEAIKICNEKGFDVDHTIVANHARSNLTDIDGVTKTWFHVEEEQASADDSPVEWVDAEHPLFLLYTSGSTGKPKGVLHTTGGYMVWAATTFKYTFDYRPGDIYFCTADIGWVTGHSYVTYGPLLNRAQSVLFEGIPTYPDAGRSWQIIQKYKVTQFYTAPTAIRSLQRFGHLYPDSCDLSSLRVLGTVGEPINPQAWLWYHSVIGKDRCSVVDTWWQTETGGHMLTPLPGATPQKPGSATLPMFGVVPVVVNEQGVELEGACEGFLCIKNTWPGQMRTVYGDHARFEQTYFSRFDGYYFTGDGCRRDADGYYWITGRTDDVLNVSGHRIGTAELESALARHEGIVEAAVVAAPHPITGECIYAFVICREGVHFNEHLVNELKVLVRHAVGPFATPETIQYAPGLPKTRSGKIMRRILRKIASYKEEDIGDISTLAEPQVVDQLLEHRPGRPDVPEDEYG